MNSKNIKFQADKVSGVEGSLFLLSAVLEGVKANDVRHKFNFSFYGLTLNIKTCKADEWVVEKECHKVCDQIILRTRKEGLKYFIKLRKDIIKEAGNFKKYTSELDVPV